MHPMQKIKKTKENHGDNGLTLHVEGQKKGVAIDMGRLLAHVKQMQPGHYSETWRSFTGQGIQRRREH